MNQNSSSYAIPRQIFRWLIPIVAILWISLQSACFRIAPRYPFEVPLLVVSEPERERVIYTLLSSSEGHGEQLEFDRYRLVDWRAEPVPEIALFDTTDGLNRSFSLDFYAMQAGKWQPVDAPYNSSKDWYTHRWVAENRLVGTFAVEEVFVPDELYWAYADENGDVVSTIQLPPARRYVGSPNSDYLLGLTADALFHVDLPTGVVETILEPNEIGWESFDKQWRIFLNPEHGYALFLKHNGMIRFDVDSGELTTIFEDSVAYRSAALSPSGQQLVVPLFEHVPSVSDGERFTKILQVDLTDNTVATLELGDDIRLPQVSSYMPKWAWSHDETQVAVAVSFCEAYMNASSPNPICSFSRTGDGIVERAELMRSPEPRITHSAVMVVDFMTAEAVLVADSERELTVVAWFSESNSLIYYDDRGVYSKALDELESGPNVLFRGSEILDVFLMAR